MTLISSRDVTYHPQSYADTGMRVFWWKGEIYRGIGADQAGLFRRLFQNGVIQQLVARGLLVESELTPLALPGYEMVVRHRTISVVSYPDEWCAPMFKDAALATLDLAIALAEYGLTLGDAHPWNVLFEVGKSGPVFVDWGSIEPICDPSWQGYEEFCLSSLYPLMLMGRGHDRMARLCLSDPYGVLESDLTYLLGGEPPPHRPAARPLRSRIIRFLQKRSRLLPGSWIQPARLAERLTTEDRRSHLRSLQWMRRQVENVALMPGRDNRPVYRGPGALPLGEWSPQQRTVQEILSELRPASLLDAGTGSGWYAELAALAGSQVTAFDIEPARVSRLYLRAREQRLPIHPLVMDFTRPTPSRGLASSGGLAATDRLRCDVVLALNLLDHIAVGLAAPMPGKQFVTLDQMAEGLSLFATHAAVVEFIPSDSPDHTLNSFIAALEKRFATVEMRPSHPDPRVLLVCRK